MLEQLLTPEALIAFLTLASLEIVLGIDNIVFISILVARLPAEQRAGAMRLGLGLAMVSRIALLFAISWIVKLEQPLINLVGTSFSGRDLILLGGGLFLIYKSTSEIHHKLEGEHEATHSSGGKAASLKGILLQIMVVDLVFSLDSVITAVGMTDIVPVMIAAVVASVLVMMLFANTVSGFVQKHPTIKVLALSFLLLIGVLLVAEGFHAHLERGYVYFAMGFSLAVELINMRIRGAGKPLVQE